jgi:hypothetical protein
MGTAPAPAREWKMVMTGLSCCIGDDRNCPEGDTAARLRQAAAAADFGRQGL